MSAAGPAKPDKEIRYPFPKPPAPGEAIEVAPGVLWLRFPLPMVLNHVNVFALDDGEGWTLVDTGLDTTTAREMWQVVRAGALGGRPVRRVVVTHHHPDHIGLAGWFQSQGAELVTTRTSWLFARMLTLDEQSLPSPETCAFWRAAGMDAERYERRVSERPFNFADVVAPLPLGYTRIANGDDLVAGGRSWIVRTGNGHAPEHATLWSRDDNLVIGGDQLLPSISPNLGVYATEPDADPVKEWLESCRSFLNIATPGQLVLPGHKLPFLGLPSRLSQLIENHEGALERLLAFLATPQTAVGCFLPLFRREISDAEYGLALVEAVAHLNHLLHAGRVHRRLAQNGAWLWQTSA